MMADLIDRQALLAEMRRSGRAAYMVVQDAPAVDAVPRDVLEQMRWERDIAIEQLNSYGVSLGEKADCAKVVRCKDCKWYKDFGTNYRLMDCSHEEGLEWVDENDFCSRGERREDDG